MRTFAWVWTAVAITAGLLPVQSAEPETRALSESEANAALEKDWLFQANNEPTAARIQDELGWTRDIAKRLATRPVPPDLSKELAQLDELERRRAGLAQAGTPSGPPDKAAVRSLYLDLRRVKRQIMFKDPLLDFNELLFIDMPYPTGGQWEHESISRSDRRGAPGARLLILKGLHPGGEVRKLAPQDKPAALWRPDLSFDAKRVLFCMKPEGDKSFHLYEVNVDGTGLRQITSGNYSDTDPIYLPNGKFLFCSTRCNTYVRCWPEDPSFVLTRCDSDGKNIYIISANMEPDYTPTMLPDGRVLYTRWEYTDKEPNRIQSLWTVNPDGTKVTVFWGNQSVWPDILMEARPIPNSRRVLFAGLGHHNIFQGSIGIVDHAKGLNYPDGLTKVTQEIPWPEVGNGPAEKPEVTNYHRSGNYTACKAPYPLSEELFIVSARPDTPFYKLLLMDVYGNRELIYAGQFSTLYAMPLKPRPVPHLIPDSVDWLGPEKNGRPIPPARLYSADVYQGMPPEVRGKAKYLQVIQLAPTTYSIGFKGQGVMPGQTVHREVHLHQGPPTNIATVDGIKRVLGTVPINEDGSVYVNLPPCQALHFQLVDESFRALQTMRSFVNMMPGENRGCTGCHEMHSTAPRLTATSVLHKEAKDLTPPPWGADESIGYQRFVQPALDKYCGACHQGEGKGRAKLDLTYRPSLDAGIFPEPYVTLVLGAKRDLSSGGYPGRCDGGIAGTVLPMHLKVPHGDIDKTLEPMKILSYKSRLVEIAMSGKHHEVKMDNLSLRKLIAWVDALCPFRGEQEIRAFPDPDPARFTDRVYPPRMKTAPVVNRAYSQDEYSTQEDRIKER